MTMQTGTETRVQNARRRVVGNRRDRDQDMVLMRQVAACFDRPRQVLAFLVGKYDQYLNTRTKRTVETPLFLVPEWIGLQEEMALKRRLGKITSPLRLLQDHLDESDVGPSIFGGGLESATVQMDMNYTGAYEE